MAVGILHEVMINEYRNQLTPVADSTHLNRIHFPNSAKCRHIEVKPT